MEKLFIKHGFAKISNKIFLPFKKNLFLNFFIYFSLYFFKNPGQGCHGLADIENGVRMAPHTALRIASISKSFTSCIIGKMVENGQINLSDKVQKYIDFPVKSETEMTISSLLSHTSGIRHYNKLVE